MYARAVWKEGEIEEEGVVSENWIRGTKRIVRWPRMSTTKTVRAIKEKMNPQDDWMTFPLTKIKMTSAVHRKCENYNMTSQAEEDVDDDEEEVVMRSRSRTKKITSRGFCKKCINRFR